jgi:uncharacterized repeat protein (TIGR01451 family)
MLIKYKAIKKYHVVLSFCGLLLAVNTAPAENRVIKLPTKSQAADPLLVTLRSYKVQLNPDGKETLVKADKVKPGDIVQYAAVYHNRGKTNIEGLKASLPIPFGMEYLAKSAVPASALASADSQHYSPEPLMRTDKNNKEVAVPYAEYQKLRWDIGTLDAGKRQEVSARMRVNQLTKSPAELVLHPNTTHQP